MDKRLKKALKRYEALYKNEIYYLIVDLVKELKDKKCLEHLTDQKIFEDIIIPYLESIGIPQEQFDYFLGYAKRLFYKKRKYSKKSLDVEQDTTAFEMEQRDLESDKIQPTLTFSRQHPLKGSANLVETAKQKELFYPFTYVKTITFESILVGVVYYQEMLIYGMGERQKLLTWGMP